MAELAVNGGPKCVPEPVEVKWPIVDERDAEHVADVVRAGRGGWCRLGLGDGEVSTFEREWAEYHDAKHALAVNNGTCAI
jgi:3-amino-5-hydroxybenzoate synthase